MPKIAGSPGKPLIHFWGRLTVATEAERRLRKHPLCRWICRTYENSPNVSHVLPDNASSTTGLNYALAGARRVAEHAQAQVNLGADPATLGFFFQNFADFYGITPELCLAEDDRVDGGREPRNVLFSDKARNGPLKIESTKVPNVTASIAYRNALRIELQSRGIGALGHWIGDSERGHEPWEWYTPASPFGTWAPMLADPRFSTEVVAFGQHRIGGGGDATLQQLITEIVGRAPGFAPAHNQNWSSGSANAPYVKEILRLRADCFQSQYAAVTIDLWVPDSFWSALRVSNYQMQGQTDPRFPMNLPGTGSPDGDHVCGFLGLNVHAPVCYANTLNDGTPDPGYGRFSPGMRPAPGVLYDDMQVFNQQRRQMGACANGSLGHLPICPWLRGIDTGDPSLTPNPSLNSRDLAKSTKLAATYPTCTEVIWWYGDNPGFDGDHPAMLEAVELVYPEWVWNTNTQDWEAA